MRFFSSKYYSAEEQLVQRESAQYCFPFPFKTTTLKGDCCFVPWLRVAAEDICLQKKPNTTFLFFCQNVGLEVTRLQMVDHNPSGQLWHMKLEFLTATIRLIFSPFKVQRRNNKREWHSVEKITLLWFYTCQSIFANRHLLRCQVGMSSVVL